MWNRTLSLLLNDARALPCVATTYQESLEWLSPREASVLGMVHYVDGLPMLAHYTSPIPEPVAGPLRKLSSRVVLFSSTGGGQSGESPPFRYRNWTMTVGGKGDAVWRGDAETVLAIPAYLAKNRRGDGLWEILFYQFLAFMHSNGGLAQTECDGKLVREALRAAVSQETFWGEAPRDITVTVSDGVSMHAVALDRPIYLRRLDSLPVCTACGGDLDGNPISHPYLKAVALADTEGLASADWDVLGPQQLVSVDRKLRVESFAL